MFLKVYRHEFKSLLKTMLITLAVGLVVALVLGGVTNFMRALAERYNEEGQYNFAIILLTSGLSMSPMAIVIVFIAQAIIIFARFYKSVATDEAYLTFTLPSDNVTQYRARFLSLLSWIFICVLALIINFVVYRIVSLIGRVWPVAEIFGYYGISLSDVFDGLLLTEGITLAIIFVIFECVQLCFAILLASKLAKKFKIGATILFIFLIEHVEGMLLSSIFMLLLSSSVSWEIDARIGTAIILFGSIVLLSGVSILWYILSKRLVANLNVD